MPVQFTPRNNAFELQRRQKQAENLRQQATESAPKLGTTAPGGYFVPENNLNRIAHLLRTHSANKAERGANEYAQGLYEQQAGDKGALAEALRGNTDPMAALQDPSLANNPAAQDALIAAQTGQIRQPTASMQEYEYARQNGYKGSFVDYQTASLQNQDPSLVAEYKFAKNNGYPGSFEEYRASRFKSQQVDTGPQIYLVGGDGSTQKVFNKDLDPKDLPETKAAQTIAVEEAKATTEKWANAGKAKTNLELFKGKNANVISKIDQALENVSGWTAGFGGAVLSSVPGTPARDLEKIIDTIKANIGFSELQAMREASPTGGALGQVSEMELKLLNAVKGSLDADQSPEQLKQTLISIRDQIIQLQTLTEQAYQADLQKFGGGQSQPTQSQNDLKSGVIQRDGWTVEKAN